MVTATCRLIIKTSGCCRRWIYFLSNGTYFIGPDFMVEHCFIIQINQALQLLHQWLYHKITLILLTACIMLKIVLFLYGTCCFTYYLSLFSKDIAAWNDIKFFFFVCEHAIQTSFCNQILIGVFLILSSELARGDYIHVVSGAHRSTRKKVLVLLWAPDTI